MSRRILSLIVLVGLVLAVSSPAAQEISGNWERIDGIWYVRINGVWVETTEEMPTYQMEPIEVVEALPDDEEDGNLTRITIPEITYIWDGTTVQELYIWRISVPYWETLESPTVKITLDPALKSGDFISTDTQHRVHLETNAPTWSWAYSGDQTSGTLSFSSQDSKSPSITFNPTKQPSGRSHPLKYTVMATIALASHSVEFKQDLLSTIRQQYIDNNSHRWNSDPQPTVPGRSPFRTYYSSGSYGAFDYSHGRTPILMYMGSVAEIIRKIEQDSTNTKARMTSGFRYPNNDPDNSLHHFGYALDMNPAWSLSDDEGRANMYRRVSRRFSSTSYDVLLHGTNPHIHIEYDK